MNILSLDLEMNQPSGKIIEVGYVIGNLYTGEVLKKVSRLCSISEEVSPRITQLTGITPEMLAATGWATKDAYKEMITLHKSYECFRNALTWGGGDTEWLRKELGEGPGWALGRRWIDAKTIYTSRCFSLGIKPQAGLAKAMTKLGLKFKGKKHRAADDAENTFYIYRRLLLEFPGSVIDSE